MREREKGMEGGREGDRAITILTAAPPRALPILLSKAVNSGIASAS